MASIPHNVPFLPSWGLEAGSGLSLPLIPLIPLDIRVWLYMGKGESDSIERMSELFMPSLELVGEELLEKAESRLINMSLFRLSVEGSEVDCTGELISPTAESVLSPSRVV